MKALVRTSKEAGGFTCMDMPKPVPAADQVLIRVKAVGVCGTDVHIYTGHVDTAIPVIVGHEFSGVIESMGSAVSGLNIGDKVVSRLNIGVCGRCRACLTGNPQMCEHRTCPGFKIHGAYAEYIAIEAKQVIPLEEKVDFIDAALAEPMAIVTHALLERTKVEPEDTVVVFGPGPIGLLAQQMAQVYGASKVIVVGTDTDLPRRLPLARDLGACRVLNSQRDDVQQAVMEITGGKGVDLVVEASGAEPAINTGLELLRRQGRMCVLGLPSRDRNSIAWLRAAEKSLSVIFNYSSSPWSWNMVVSMLNRGVINTGALVTHTYPLEEYRTMFEEIKNGAVIKGVFLPDSSVSGK